MLLKSYVKVYKFRLYFEKSNININVLYLHGEDQDTE